MALQVISEPTTFTGGLSANNFPISVGGGVTTSSTAPSSPSAGSLWFNTENGNLYIYYNDGNSQQWVAPDNSGGGNGKIAQVVVASTNVSASTTLEFSAGIPQQSEGTEFLTASITPTNPASKLYIRFTSNMSNSALGSPTIALFRDSNSNAIVAVSQTITGASYQSFAYIEDTVDANSISSTTFKIRFARQPATGHTAYLLRSGATPPLLGGTVKAYLTITEILP
jgi:hypothetical protein